MSKIAPYFPPDPYYKQVWQAVTASDGSIYVRMEDEVRLSVFTTTAGLTITLNGIFVDLEGELKPFEMQLVTAGSGTRESATRFLGPGFLLYSYPTLSGGTPAVGAVTVSLELLQSHNTGGPIVKQLFFGALTAQGYFPNVQVGNTVTVSGTVTATFQYTPLLVSVTNPAAGAEWITTVPASTVWRVQSVHFKFVADANVATRNIWLRVLNGSVNLGEYFGDTGWTAGLTALFAFGVNTPFSDRAVVGIAGFVSSPIVPLILPAGATLGSHTQNIQVGDQYSNIAVGVLQAAA